jgi:hypothetical protein
MYLFSASAIYDGLYPRTSPIIISGDRTARSDRELHAGRRCLCLRKDAERSLGTLCSAGCTTFIGLPSDIPVFCAPQLFPRPSQIYRSARRFALLKPGNAVGAQNIAGGIPILPRPIATSLEGAGASGSSPSEWVDRVRETMVCVATF